MHLYNGIKFFAKKWQEVNQACKKPATAIQKDIHFGSSQIWSRKLSQPVK